MVTLVTGRCSRQYIHFRGISDACAHPSGSTAELCPRWRRMVTAAAAALPLARGRVRRCCSHSHTLAALSCPARLHTYVLIQWNVYTTRLVAITLTYTHGCLPTPPLPHSPGASLARSAPLVRQRERHFVGDRQRASGCCCGSCATGRGAIGRESAENWVFTVEARRCTAAVSQVRVVIDDIPPAPPHTNWSAVAKPAVALPQCASPPLRSASTATAISTGTEHM